MRMLYSPFEAAEQAAASAGKLPETSWKMYQFSVGVPPALAALAPPPQPASVVAATASISPRRQLRRKRIAAPSLAGAVRPQDPDEPAERHHRQRESRAPASCKAAVAAGGGRR
jgi:hypothetical protein